MDEIWGGNMSIMQKRIKNIAKAMDNADMQNQTHTIRKWQSHI